MTQKQSNGFFQRVYEAVCRIPCGQVATYGQIAMMAGSPRASRAVGRALHVNPQPGIIPCHRVVNRVGRCAPAFAFGGPEIQHGLLEQEAVSFLPDGRVDLTQCQWHGR
ncbi:MAG: MGMT family protein [Oscillospiraceae bacterium]